jgi:hypothetical protein
VLRALQAFDDDIGGLHRDHREAFVFPVRAGLHRPLSSHRQRPSHGRVRGFSRPSQVFPGGGVTVVSQRSRVRLSVLTARVPSSQTVYRRPRVFSSEVVPWVADQAEQGQGEQAPHG